MAKDRVNPGSDAFDTAIGGLAPGGGWPQKSDGKQALAKLDALESEGNSQ